MVSEIRSTFNIRKLSAKEVQERLCYIESLANNIEEIQSIVTTNGGELDGLTYATTGNEPILSEETCCEVRKYIDINISDFRCPSSSSTTLRNDLSKFLSGDEFINLVGKESTIDLIEFFHKTIGYEAIITSIKLQRSDTTVDNNDDLSSEFTGHVDGINTLLIFLQENIAMSTSTNDTSSDNQKPSLYGGGIIHFTKTGLIKTERFYPGLAIVHGDNVYHETYPWRGTRDMICIGSDPKHNSKDACLFSDSSLFEKNYNRT